MVERGGGGCPKGRNREYKGCKGGGMQGRWICVCSKSMGGAMWDCVVKALRTMHLSMIKSVATSMWVAFESKDKGVDYFVIWMSMEIFKVVSGTSCE